MNKKPVTQSRWGKTTRARIAQERHDARTGKGRDERHLEGVAREMRRETNAFLKLFFGG